ncbi:MAG: ATP synthase F1 subunit delta [Clostridia bacterium]|nr:ATP synthase F1 subunit delta [Clostridia bacterium]
MIDPREYGKALFLLAEERGSSKAVGEDLKTVKAVLEQNPDYLLLLDTPAVKSEEKCALIDKAFADIDRDVVNFLKILSEKHEVYNFPRCADTFGALLDESLGILRAQVVSAVPLSDSQKERLSKKLGFETGKTVLLSNTVDPSLLGGVQLRYAGVQIDGSLAGRLSALEKAIRESAI